MVIDVAHGPEALRPQNLARVTITVKAFPSRYVYDFIDFIPRCVESITSIGGSTHVCHLGIFWGDGLRRWYNMGSGYVHMTPLKRLLADFDYTLLSPSSRRPLSEAITSILCHPEHRFHIDLTILSCVFPLQCDTLYSSTLFWSLRSPQLPCI